MGSQEFNASAQVGPIVAFLRPQLRHLPGHLHRLGSRQLCEIDIVGETMAVVAAPPPPMAVVAPGTVFNIVRTWPPVAAGGSAVAPPPPAEYWGNDADTVFVEGLTTLLPREGCP